MKKMKNSLFYKVFILVISIAFTFKSVGQEIPLPTSILSPSTLQGQSLSMDKSLNTGVINPEIQLQKLSYRGVDLDLSVSYDGSGIKIDEHPGWVGQNWTLKVGGCISRKVNGLMDELSFSNYSFGESHKGFFYHFDELNSNNVASSIEMAILANNAGWNNESYDYQPDEFYFNFMGFSGKFFMGNDGAFKVVSDKNLVVVMEDTLIHPLFEKSPHLQGATVPFPKVIAGFKIIDGSGTSYYFGYDTTAIEYSIDFFWQSFGPYWIANSWYLTKIVDRYGVEIFSFQYIRSNFVATFYRNDFYRKLNYDGHPSMGGNPNTKCEDIIKSSYGDFGIDGFLQSPVYLNKITFGPNKDILVNFYSDFTNELPYDSLLLAPKCALVADSFARSVNQSNQYLYYLQHPNPYILENNSYLSNLRWRKLNHIVIKNSNLFLYIEFKYEDTCNQRLNLKEIIFKPSDFAYNPSATTNKYCFDYNGFSRLPGYLSRREDHWGYYRGNPYQFTYQNWESFSSQKDCVPDSLQVGLLTRITFPTGGFTNFNFEPNYYYGYISDNCNNIVLASGYGGGLRIKRVENSTEDFVTATNYFYGSDSTSPNICRPSGVLSFKPRYYWYSYDTLDYGEHAFLEISNFVSRTMIPFENYSGGYVYYNEVAEVNPDNSYIIYNYNTFDTNYLSVVSDESPILNFNSQSSPYFNRSSHGLFRGKLIGVRYYNGSNSLVRREKFDYLNSSFLPTHYSFGASVIAEQACPNSATTYFKGCVYKMYYDDYDFQSHHITDYLPSGDLETNTLYFYKSYNITGNFGSSNIRLLRRQIKNFGPNYYDILMDSLFYPVDLLTDSCMANLVNSFIIDEPIILKHFRSWTTPIGVTKFKYRLLNGALVVKDKKLVSFSDINDLKEEVSYDIYSPKGLLLQYTPKNSPPVALLWDSNFNYVMAEIVNSIFPSISNFNFLSGEYDSDLLWSQLQSVLPNSLIKTYSYKGFSGLLSETSVNGNTIKYDYDMFGRIKYLKNKQGEFMKKFEYNFKKF